MITGINHLTLAVRDIDESFGFYSRVLGFKPAARWPRGAYLLVGDLWLALIVDIHCRTNASPEYTHVAFSTSEANFPKLCVRIVASGTRIWKRNESEGPSLYFEDPNGHKLELHVGGIESRLRSIKADPWPGAEFHL
jgi:catechol 2,3-dioxygenase-like lactoylglutathione lyase family enzyme